MTRQSLKTSDNITEVAGITLATKRKRVRQWDVTHNRDLRSYRGIPPELHAEITAIADKLHIPTGDVARGRRHSQIAPEPAIGHWCARLRKGPTTLRWKRPIGIAVARPGISPP